MKLLKYQHFYLVGIKGVAMTALAQCLLDAGKQVRGSDTAEKFVTQPILDNRKIVIDVSFDQLPKVPIDCLIFTAAHGGPDNPQVLAAQRQKIATMSHAQALAELFNNKQGVAVCGVGGKTTASAMITWILEKTQSDPSYAIGVGQIMGLNTTGRWSKPSQYLIAEADEYVTDPQAAAKGQKLTPRFSFLKPYVIVCTNLKFDHPDVYKDFRQTRNTYRQFFLNLKPRGYLIVNGDDSQLWELAKQVAHQRSDLTLVTYGEQPHNNIYFDRYLPELGQTTSHIVCSHQSIFDTQQLSLAQLDMTLRLPGKFNVYNALAAIAATRVVGVSLSHSIVSLAGFRSTKRRSEWVGEKQGVKYYDDYAHHPDEISAIIRAFQEWFPTQRLVVAFQSHTFSRTKQLFDQFVEALAINPEVVMIDIFPSAREKFDASVTSDRLCQAIIDRHPDRKAVNLGTIDQLAKYCRTQLHSGDVLLTLGAGDIYLVHDLIE